MAGCLLQQRLSKLPVKRTGTYKVDHVLFWLYASFAVPGGTRKRSSVSKRLPWAQPLAAGCSGTCPSSWAGMAWQPGRGPCLPASIPARSQPARAAAKGLQLYLIWLPNPVFKNASRLPPSDMYWRKVNPGQHFLCYNDWFYLVTHSPSVTEGASLA